MADKKIVAKKDGSKTVVSGGKIVGNLPSDAAKQPPSAAANVSSTLAAQANTDDVVLTSYARVAAGRKRHSVSAEERRLLRAMHRELNRGEGVVECRCCSYSDDNGEWISVPYPCTTSRLLDDLRETDELEAQVRQLRHDYNIAHNDAIVNAESANRLQHIVDEIRKSHAKTPGLYRWTNTTGGSYEEFFDEYYCEGCGWQTKFEDCQTLELLEKLEDEAAAGL